MNDSEPLNYFHQLRLQMADAFNMNELQTLSYDLLLDWEELAGDTKSVKITSMIIMAVQNDQFEPLITTLNARRPKNQWALPDDPNKQNVDFLFFLNKHQHANQIPTAYASNDNLSPQQMRNRQNFLNIMKKIWIDGVLYDLLHKYVIVTLKKTYAPEAIARDARTAPALREENSQQPAPKSIEELFEESGRKLLILGLPGSGKTITLLQLALDLVNRALSIGAEPMPVIINLSTWSKSWSHLQDWLIEEIFLQYQVARDLVKEWLDQNRFVLLLDGLDEVPTALQNSCVIAINHFLSEHNSEIVVCSRIQEYKQLNEKLNLGNAIELNPLTREQVNQFLVETDPNLNSLREILPQDEQLQELAKSPLMLSIMTLAYQDISSQELAPLDTPEKQRAHLFDYYIDKMFTLRPTFDNDSRAAATQWLTNIAQYMNKSNLPAFQIETIQPQWLTNGKTIVFYWLLVSLLAGLVVGLGTAFMSTVSSTVYLSLSYSFSTSLKSAFRLGVYDGVIFGTSATAGIFSGIWFFRSLKIPFRRQISLTVIISALISAFVGGGLAYLLYQNLFSGVTLGFITGLTSSLLAVLFATRVRIKLVESLKLTIPAGRDLVRSAGRFGLMGLLIGCFVSSSILIVQLLGFVSYQTLDLVTSALFFGLVGLVVGTILILWQPKEVSERSKPNQGIYNSFWNAVKVTFLTGLILTLFNAAVQFGLLSVRVFILNYIFYFLIISSFFYYGGVTVIQHYALRLMLKQRALLPYPVNDKNLVQYLDDMVDLTFLQPAGNSWIFIHRTLLEHFSDLSNKQQSFTKPG